MTGHSTGRKSLVTGAGGFVGSHLAAALAANGDHVLALDLDLQRVRHLAAASRLELLEGDVTDRDLQARALAGVDTVYHLAAAHLGAAVKADEFHRINVEGTESLAESALGAGVRRFVHCSSVGVYGRIPDPPADERTTCRPELPYERTKLAGEAAVQAAMRRGLPATILRPAWIYGPGCPRTERLFRALGKGRFVIAGGGRNLRHSIYIRDMIDAFRLAAESESAVGELFVIGDARAVTVRHLVDEMARIARARRPPSVPHSLLLVAAIAAETLFGAVGREPPISRRTLRFFTSNTSFDIGKARRLLGFEPRYGLRRGLEETYELLHASPAGPSEP